MYTKRIKLNYFLFERTDMKVYFYIPDKAINEATIYYTKIVEKAFFNQNVEVIRVNHLNFSFDKKTDYIFVIRVIDFLKVKLSHRTKNIIIWFQGILAEEYEMLHQNNLKSKIVFRVFSLCEKYVLKHAFYSFFVSNAMTRFFEKKHDIKINPNHIVMPCYNKLLNKDLFFKPKKELSFVYAGTLFAWQCFEETVKLYKEIECTNAQAKFYVYTKEKEAALDLLQKYEVQNYEILYVTLDDLDQALSQYKYGFLLREDDKINNVSTPTKMNSYLSVGLIPIYTNVICDFEEHIDLQQYTFKFNFNASKVEIANKIAAQPTVDYNDYFAIVEKNFEHYYDDEYNCTIIEERLIKKSMHGKNN